MAHLENVAADEDGCGVVSAPHNQLKPDRTTTLTPGILWHRIGPHPAASGKRLPSHPAAIGMPETRVKYAPPPPRGGGSVGGQNKKIVYHP